MSAWLKSGLALCIATACIACCAFVAETNAQPAPNSQEADARVRRALQYEVEGQSDFRNIMLRAALDVDPQHVLANWLSGHVRQDNRWLTIDEVRKRASNDEVLAKYRQLRDAASGDLKRQLNLARWCARSGLAERSELHYAHLLYNPSLDEKTRQEILRKLGLRQVAGRLMSDEQLKNYERTAAKLKRATDRWQPQLLKWHKAIEGEKEDRSAFAIQQMLTVDDPSILPVLEPFLPVSGNRFGAQLVRLLARFPNHESTQSLARFAVFSPWSEVRNEAIGVIKSRPLHDFAPMFLSWLASPVESRWRVFRDYQGNLRYEHLALRKGANENELLAVERVGVPTDPIVRNKFVEGGRLVNKPTNGLPTYLGGQDVRRAQHEGTYIDWGKQANFASPAGVLQSDTGQQAIVALGLLAQASQREKVFQFYNASVSARNNLVFHALEQTTGAPVIRDAVNWWSWWDNYNEVYKPPKRTRYWIDRKRSSFTRSVGTQLFTYDVLFRRQAGYSCFVAGTPVWTESGLTPIEKIQAGDRVLSQDPESGELAFKLVICKTLRPPAPLTRISITGEEILTTKGHPMWVVSQGWRMAKFIEEGQELHGLKGGTLVQGAELLKRQEEAHNLVVVDFSTYFVGKTGVLVHDNTYRKTSQALVPGLVKQ